MLDREEIEFQRKQKIARFLRYFGAIMGVFYLTVGFTLIFLPIFAGIPATTRYIFGALILLYGIFRLYRSIRKPTE